MRRSCLYSAVLVCMLALGVTAVAATSLLWAEYSPQYKVWIPFAAIGIAATVALGIFGQMATDQAATQKAVADQAEATRVAAAKNAANQAKLGNVNTLMSMLGQAQDTGGQQVTVKAADPAKIGYIYDWSSIFANPSQEKMFASPYGSYADIPAAVRRP